MPIFSEAIKSLSNADKQSKPLLNVKQTVKYL